LIHISNTNDFSNNVSFGDWTDKERTLIFKGASLTREDVGSVMLKLLESGGGGSINGDYDVLSMGFNIHSDDIDEQSFLLSVQAVHSPYQVPLPEVVKTLEELLKACLNLLALF
jgi:hypothetical protein